jgi:hypothetical protein
MRARNQARRPGWVRLHAAWCRGQRRYGRLVPTSTHAPPFPELRLAFRRLVTRLMSAFFNFPSSARVAVRGSASALTVSQGITRSQGITSASMSSRLRSPARAPLCPGRRRRRSGKIRDEELASLEALVRPGGQRDGLDLLFGRRAISSRCPSCSAPARASTHQLWAGPAGYAVGSSG